MAVERLEEKKTENDEWRAGRVFTVQEEIFSTKGDKCLACPGYKYQVKTNLSHHAVGYESSLINMKQEDKVHLLNKLHWADDRISRSLKMLIKDDPEGKLVRGLVKSELGHIMPKKETPKAFEDWMAWIRKAPEKSPDLVTNAQDTVRQYTENARRAERERANEPTRFVHIEGCENVGVSLYGNRSDHFEGDIPVPISILRSNNLNAVMDYIYDHARNHIEMERGEANFDDSSEELGDSDGLEIESNDAPEVIAAILAEEGDRT